MPCRALLAVAALVLVSVAGYGTWAALRTPEVPVLTRKVQSLQQEVAALQKKRSKEATALQKEQEEDQRQQHEVQELQDVVGTLRKQQEEVKMEQREVEKHLGEVAASEKMRDEQKPQQQVVTSSTPKLWLATWDLSGYDFTKYKMGETLDSPSFDLGGLHRLKLRLVPKENDEGNPALYLCAPDGHQIEFSLRLDDVTFPDQAPKFEDLDCWGKSVSSDVWGWTPPTRFGSAVLAIRSITHTGP